MFLAGKAHATFPLITEVIWKHQIEASQTRYDRFQTTFYYEFE